jgi:hypothetical protein
MANLLTVGGLSATPYPEIEVFGNSTGGAFSGWNAGTNSYENGQAVTINTPNNLTVPNSTVANNNCNGQRGGTIVVSGDGGSIAGASEYGIAGTVSGNSPAGGASYYVGWLSDELWTTQYGAFGGDSSTWGEPASVGGTVQAYPGNMSISEEEYTITMLAGLAQGENAAANRGFRINYRAAVGGLYTTLNKIQPAIGAGAPPQNFGFLSNGMNDEAAAAVWLAWGYGLFVGDNSNTIRAFWT